MKQSFSSQLCLLIARCFYLRLNNPPRDLSVSLLALQMGTNENWDMRSEMFMASAMHYKALCFYSSPLALKWDVETMHIICQSPDRSRERRTICSNNQPMVYLPIPPVFLINTSWSRRTTYTTMFHQTPLPVSMNQLRVPEHDSSRNPIYLHKKSVYAIHSIKLAHRNQWYRLTSIPLIW